MNASTLLFVAMGGAVGAVGRFAVMSAVGAMFGHGFPFGTITVNILGSFILGAMVEASALVWSPSPELRAMIVVGVLGAFTTFSTFSLDVLTLMNRGEVGAAFAYVAVSVIASIAALWLGLTLTRLVIS